MKCLNKDYRPILGSIAKEAGLAKTATARLLAPYSSEIGIA